MLKTYKQKNLLMNRTLFIVINLILCQFIEIISRIYTRMKKLFVFIGLLLFGIGIVYSSEYIKFPNPSTTTAKANAEILVNTIKDVKLIRPEK